MAFSDYIDGLQHVGIPTDNLDFTIKFYKSLGFKQSGGPFSYGKIKCTFLQLNNLTIETWKGDPVTKKAGAINHISLNTNNVNKAFTEAKNQGLTLLNDKIQFIPSYWKRGIKFFNMQGPNKEIIEVCQIL